MSSNQTLRSALYSLPAHIASWLLHNQSSASILHSLSCIQYSNTIFNLELPKFSADDVRMFFKDIIVPASQISRFHDHPSTWFILARRTAHLSRVPRWSLRATGIHTRYLQSDVYCSAYHASHSLPFLPVRWAVGIGWYLWGLMMMNLVDATVFPYAIAQVKCRSIELGSHDHPR